MTLIAPGAVGVRVLVLVFQLFLVLALRWTKKAGVISQKLQNSVILNPKHHLFRA
jgi:hypothetical protein